MPKLRAYPFASYPVKVSGIALILLSVICWGSATGAYVMDVVAAEHILLGLTAASVVQQHR